MQVGHFWLLPLVQILQPIVHVDIPWAPSCAGCLEDMHGQVDSECTHNGVVMQNVVDAQAIVQDIVDLVDVNVGS